MNNINLLLASASPRRAELLASLAIPFQTFTVDLDETPIVGESVARYALRLAEAKSMVGHKRYAQQTGHALLTLGSDTCGWFNGDILGKPRDSADAHAMLMRLSGQWHEIHTAIALYDGQRLQSRLVTSRVLFADLNDALVAQYVATGEPLDKAGSYGIQGKGAALVARLEGSYSGVVGLPLAELRLLLAEFDTPIWQESV